MSKNELLQWRDPIVLSVIALIQIVHWSPASLAPRLFVKGFAFIAYHFSRNKRRVIENHLLEMFDGKLDEGLKREIVRGVFHEFWEEKFSLVLPRSERTVLRGVDIRGMDRLEQALEKGRGVILWESNALSNRTRSKQILHAKGFTVHQIHSENHLEGFLNPHPSKTWVQRQIIKRMLEKFEMQYLKEIIYLPRSDSLAFTKILLGRLRQNAILCVSGDAHGGQKRIPLPLFHHIELFPTGMVSLAKISGAALLPIFCISEETGRKRLVIEPPISIDRGLERERGLENGVSQYVRLLESYIRRYPKQYIKLAPYSKDKDD